MRGAARGLTLFIAALKRSAQAAQQKTNGRHHQRTNWRDASSWTSLRVHCHPGSESHRSLYDNAWLAPARFFAPVVNSAKRFVELIAVLQLWLSTLIFDLTKPRRASHCETHLERWNSSANTAM